MTVLINSNSKIKILRTAEKASHRWMAVKCYKVPRPQGRATGEVKLLGRRKDHALPTYLLGIQTDVAEIKDGITPQLITKTSVTMMKSCYD